MRIAHGALCCLGCRRGEEVVATDVEADIQAIKDIAAKWEAAINSGDIDTIMSFYADNPVIVPSNEPAVTGKEAIRDGYEKLFDETG